MKIKPLWPLLSVVAIAIFTLGFPVVCLYAENQDANKTAEKSSGFPWFKFNLKNKIEPDKPPVAKPASPSVRIVALQNKGEKSDMVSTEEKILDKQKRSKKSAGLVKTYHEAPPDTVGGGGGGGSAARPVPLPPRPVQLPPRIDIIRPVTVVRPPVNPNADRPVRAPERVERPPQNPNQR